MKMDRLLVGRKDLCRMLGDVSISHLIRLEKLGKLMETRVQAGPRVVRYDVRMVQKLIDSKKLF